MKRTYKIIGVILVAFACAALLGPAFAHAQTQTQTQTPDFFSCAASTGDVATCGIYVVAGAINAIFALLVSLGAFLIQMGLRFNAHIFDSPTVQIGFSVSLAIANLGFVLGIIIIALATILRNQTYGIKQLLWKLVLMAVLVNFGLVITSPIVSFSDSMTNYFLTAVAGNGIDGAQGFVNNLTNAFQPQAVATPTVNPTNIIQKGCTTALAFSPFGPLPGATELCSKLTQVATGQQPQAQDTFLQSFLASVFSVVLSAIIAFTFLTLAVLLLVRYAAMGILLVLLPLAWLTWIFPRFSSNFSKWWSEFVRWTFFPAMALFFVYLAFQTASLGTTSGAQYMRTTAALQAGAGSGPEAGLAIQTGTVGPIQQAADEALLAALMIGGLMAAGSLSGKAGGVVINGAKSAAGFVGGYVGKQTKKGARLAYQKAGGDKLTQALREGRVGGALKRIPVVGGVVGGVVQRGESLAGRGIGSIATNEALVKEASKNVPKDSAVIKQNLAGSMNTQDNLAHISELIKRKELDENVMVNGKKVADYIDSRPDMVARYGWGKDAKDADKGIGNDKAVRDAAKEVENLKKAGQDTTKAMEDLAKATENFVVTLKKEDMSKMGVNAIFTPADEKTGNLSDKAIALMRAFARQSPQLVPGALTKMKGAILNNFDKQYRDILKSEIKNTTDDVLLNRLRKAQSSYNKAYASNSFTNIPTEEREGGAEKKEEKEASTPKTS